MTRRVALAILLTCWLGLSAGGALAYLGVRHALLEYLAMRAGQVVSRSDVWEHLYDMNDQSTSNVVDVYIGYLRNKVDKPFDRKLIQTRRGMGYVLSADRQEGGDEAP